MGFPTNNAGMRNKSSVKMCTRRTHVFARLIPICMPSRCLVTKLPRRSSGGSLLRVRCWLGVSLSPSSSSSSSPPDLNPSTYNPGLYISLYAHFEPPSSFLLQGRGLLVGGVSKKLQQATGEKVPSGKEGRKASVDACVFFTYNGTHTFTHTPSPLFFPWLGKEKADTFSFVMIIISQPASSPPAKSIMDKGERERREREREREVGSSR